jgi:uncharacterized membrane protein
MDGTCLPFLMVKMLSGEGSLLMWGGFVCRNTIHADYRYSRSTVCTVSPRCDVCATNAICVIVSVTVT